MKKDPTVSPEVDLKLQQMVEIAKSDDPVDYLRLAAAGTKLIIDDMWEQDHKGSLSKIFAEAVEDTDSTPAEFGKGIVDQCVDEDPMLTIGKALAYVNQMIVRFQVVKQQFITTVTDTGDHRLHEAATHLRSDPDLDVQMTLIAISNLIEAILEFREEQHGRVGN